jgi:hypothetical protein
LPASNAQVCEAAVSSSVVERRYEFFGCRFRVSTSSVLALTLLDRLYGPYVAAPGQAELRFVIESRAATADADWRLRTDGGPAAAFLSLTQALQELEYSVCQRALDGHPTWVMLHGATVCGDRGAVFIAGHSESGKTTLSLALAARGHTVASDDIALLNREDGSFHPLPRCFHLDAQSRRLLRRAGLRLPALARRYGFVTPADVNSGRHANLAVTHVIALDPERDAQPALTSLPQATMVAQLSEEAGWGDVPTVEALSALARFAGGASCWRLRSGRLQATAARVSALLV